MIKCVGYTEAHCNKCGEWKEKLRIIIADPMGGKSGDIWLCSECILSLLVREER